MTILAILIFAAVLCFFLPNTEGFKHAKPLLEPQAKVKVEPDDDYKLWLCAKRFGIWLMDSGKWTRNKRKRKRLNRKK